MNLKNLLYILTCLSFCTIIGAGIYETITLWPMVYSAPPKSLAIFQGEYAYQSTNFWINIHPVTLLFFIATIIFHWKTDRKKFLLIPLVIYVAILATTFAYFVPELIDITGATYSDTVDPDLVQRGRTWNIANIIRAFILVGTGMYLLFGLTQKEDKLG